MPGKIGTTKYTNVTKGEATNEPTRWTTKKARSYRVLVFHVDAAARSRFQSEALSHHFTSTKFLLPFRVVRVFRGLDCFCGDDVRG